MEVKMEDKLYRSTGSEGSPTDIRWKNRNVSLDILRILCMFLIVLGHAMIHGQVLDAVAVNSPNYFWFMYCGRSSLFMSTVLC